MIFYEVFVFLVSLFGCLLLVATRRWHEGLTGDAHGGVQNMHSEPALRIGGVAIYLGLACAWYFARGGVAGLIGTLLVAGLPAFFFGLLEDLSNRIGIRLRLLATAASGVIACLMSGASLSGLDVWGLDPLLQWLPLSIAFTAFAIAGVANAFNIIDGLNGLSSGTMTLVSLGLAGIALAVGDLALAKVCLLLGGVVLGFLVVNLLTGKIFLGDGGAYFTGFALAWLAVLLVERNDAVSPFAVLLIFIKPVFEVLFSIFRRVIRGHSPTHADRLHFHSLFVRRYLRRWLAGASPRVVNSIGGFLLALLTLPPVIFAQQFYARTDLCLVAIVVLVLGYLSLYARMVRHHWCSPIAFILEKPALRRRRYA